MSGIEDPDDPPGEITSGDTRGAVCVGDWPLRVPGMEETVNVGIRLDDSFCEGSAGPGPRRGVKGSDGRGNGIRGEILNSVPLWGGNAPTPCEDTRLVDVDAEKRAIVVEAGIAARAGNSGVSATSFDPRDLYAGT